VSVLALSFNTSANLLSAAYTDGRIVLWSMRTFAELRTIYTSMLSPHSAYFYTTEQGATKFVAIAAPDRSVQIMPLEQEFNAVQ
jgi:hypothetical protein